MQTTVKHRIQENWPDIIRITRKLEDPFDSVFPLQQVMRDLDSRIEASELHTSRLYDSYGCIAPWKEVEAEHGDHVIRNHYGAAFVLSQVLITEAVTSLKKLHSLVGGHPALPAGKPAILKLESAFTVETEAPKIEAIEAIDSLANYFKHCFEWPNDWNTANPSSHEGRTIATVTRLGLRAGNRMNLQDGIDALGIENCEELFDVVTEWRERLYKRVTNLLRENSELFQDN